MNAETRAKWSETQGGGKRLIVGCWCSAEEYLDLLYLPGEFPELCARVTRWPGGWLARLRGAWEMLLGRPHSRGDEVMISDADRLRLVEFLSDCKGSG